MQPCIGFGMPQDIRDMKGMNDMEDMGLGASLGRIPGEPCARKVVTTPTLLSYVVFHKTGFREQHPFTECSLNLIGVQFDFRKTSHRLPASTASAVVLLLREAYRPGSYETEQTQSCA